MIARRVEAGRKTRRPFFMKTIAPFFWLIAFSLSIFAQTTADPAALASFGAQRVTVADLPPEVAQKYLNLTQTVAEKRRELLAEQLDTLLFEAEAKTRGTTADELIAEIKAKVPAPAESAIQAVYDANRQAIGNRSLAEVRPQIVLYLRDEPEQKALNEALAALRTKHKVAVLKDVNAVNLKPTDVLATVGARAVTVQNFETENRIALYETRARVFDEVKFALDEALYNALLAAEAQAQNIAASDLIAREVTDKMRDYSAAEREALNAALREKLFAKYKPQMLLKEPAPLRLDVATADNPAKGPATAPVTVVMFSDFQCSHCAATHPVLEKVLAAYGAQVRFVVRDFPLTMIHEHALDAAHAANAARAQGKFFEYIEILYRNQDALDRESLKKYAGQLGLNLTRFELDWQSEKTAAEVRRDLADGRSYGINGTPTVFVNGIKVRQLSAEGFRQAIDRALKK